MTGANAFPARRDAKAMSAHLAAEAAHVLKVLEAHASVRDYKAEAVPDELLVRLIQAGQRAPSDATGQMYSLVRVRDPAKRERIWALSGEQRHLREAPVLLVVCLDVHRMRRILEHRGVAYGMEARAALLFGITDAAMFAQSMAIAGEAAGLGVCFVGGLQNHAPDVARLLKLPRGVLPLWGMTLGWPASKAPPKPRLPVDLLLHEDEYGEPTGVQLDRAFEVMAKSTRSGDWLNPLSKYFAEGGHMAMREPTMKVLFGEQGFEPR